MKECIDPVSNLTIKTSIYDFKFILILLFLINEYARPLIFSKLRLVLLLEIIFVCILLSRKNIYKYNDSVITWCWLILFLEMFLHLFIASNNYMALQFFKSTISYGLFFLVVSICVDSFKKIKITLLCFILINSFCAIKGILEGGMVPANGFMADENDFALSMNISMPIAIYFSFTVSGWKRYGLWILAFLMFCGGVYSLSRGGMVGLATIVLLMWLTSQKKAISLLLLLLAACFFISNMPSSYRDELLSVYEEGAQAGTGRERLEFWKVSARVFGAYPLLGVGQGNLPYRLAEFQGEGYWKRGIGGRAVHSLYFTLIAELGIVGIFIFSLLLRKIFRYCNILRRQGTKDEQILAKGLLIGFVAFLSTGSFLSVLYYPHFWILLTFVNMLWVNRSQGQAPTISTGRPTLCFNS